MISKLKSIPFYLIFCSIVLVVVLISSTLTSYFFNVYHLRQQVVTFMSKGARFTAEDGQRLCLRVKDLEEHSYGFRDVGHKPLECNYSKKSEEVKP